MSRLTKTMLGVLPTVTTLTCLALAGWIWLPYNDQQAPRALTAAPVPGTAPQAQSDQLSTGAEALSARPLFHMSRRPHAAPEAAAAPEPAQVTLSLTGVLGSGDLQIALLQLSNTPGLLRRRVGESVGDWRILAMTKTTITVVTPDGEQQVIGLSRSSP